MSLKVEPTPLEGVLLLTPTRFGDSRGFFSESWSRRMLEAVGLSLPDFVQDNHSLSARAGTVRGLHFQSPPHAQGKLVRCGRGRLFDVAVDVRKAKSLEAALPWLYLKGISTGEMDGALKALLGPDATGFSANTVARLKAKWGTEYCDWCKSDLSRDDWAYLWVDGIYSGLRAAEDRLCALVVIGVNARGEKHFLAIEDGVRESTQSWREVLLALKARGLKTPKLAIGDGAMGFWAALEEIFPTTRQQRCWVHKTANALNCLPKRSQPKAKKMLHDIWQAETKKDAEAAFDLFIETYEPKYSKAATCLIKDQEELLSFFDFPAQHWQSIRTTNPIESTFATIRHRTKRAKGCLTRHGMLHMMFKLAQCAETSWRKLRGFAHLADVIEGVDFINGVKPSNPDRAAA